MNSFPLVISSPGGEIFRENATAFYVRGTEGDLAVMAGHAPFITTVKPCDCRIVKEDGSSVTGHTDGGILTVAGGKVTFLTGRFD